MLDDVTTQLSCSKSTYLIVTFCIIYESVIMKKRINLLPILNICESIYIPHE